MALTNHKAEHKPIVYTLLGPTGSGKTGLVTSLDSRYYEVVSCDSRQVYREMPVGTATPTPEEQEKIPHHCISFWSPADAINAAIYVEYARKAIEEILSRGKSPILVGGTGFYYTALRSGLFEAGQDPVLREELKDIPLSKKLDMIRRLDPDALAREDQKLSIPGKIHPNDEYRVDRALEITIASGIPWTHHWKEARKNRDKQSPYRFIGFWLNVEGEIYREMLLKRSHSMLEAGFVEEAEYIYNQYGENCPALGALGYDTAISIIRGDLSIQDAPEILAQSHYRYGKKQRTYFRREKDLKPILPGQFLEQFTMLQDRILGNLA